MIFLELVPRDEESLINEAKQAVEKYPQLTGINIPDIIQLELRSHQAAEILLKEKVNVIPHIRCIDRPLEQTVNIVKNLLEKGLKSILVIKGDKPSGINTKNYPISSVMVVEKLKDLFPELTVYCGLDQYRTSMYEELEYCQMKQIAGADGFFTQPFFDIELAKMYLEHLEEMPVFIGVSPVISEKSFKYWKNKNKAVFPKSFQLELKYNCNLAKKIINLASKYQQHAYLMPITVPSQGYMENIF